MWQDARDRVRHLDQSWLMMERPTPVRLTVLGVLEKTKGGEPHDGWAMQCVCCAGVFYALGIRKSRLDLLYCSGRCRTRHHRHGEHRKQRYCRSCGHEMVKKVSALYCSDACRQIAYRQRRQAALQAPGETT